MRMIHKLVSVLTIRSPNLLLFLDLIATIAVMPYLTTKHVHLIGKQFDRNFTAHLEHHLYVSVLRALQRNHMQTHHTPIVYSITHTHNNMQRLTKVGVFV